MEKNTVTIDLERYNELIKAEMKLETIKNFAESEKREYGYSSEMSKAIDAVLGVTRE